MQANAKCWIFSLALTQVVCAQSVRTFNKRASSLENTVVLCISADLPFAQARFCGAEGLENVVTLSTFRSSFSNDYGVTLTESPLRGLTARAVVVLMIKTKFSTLSWFLKLRKSLTTKQPWLFCNWPNKIRPSEIFRRPFDYLQNKNGSFKATVFCFKP